jgi:hypothetical protein
MASVVDICNKALSLVGQETITSLDDESPHALACRSHWTMLRNAILRGHKWNCVKRRARLPRLLATPDFGFKYYYQLPALCLMALNLDNGEFFEVEGRKILTDSELCDLHYIEADDDSTIYDAQLAMALSYLLASEIAPQMTSSNTEASRLLQIGEKILGDAKASDAFEGKKRDQRGSKLLKAHYG